MSELARLAIKERWPLRFDAAAFCILGPTSNDPCGYCVCGSKDFDHYCVAMVMRRVFLKADEMQSFKRGYRNRVNEDAASGTGLILASYFVSTQDRGIPEIHGADPGAKQGTGMRNQADFSLIFH
jgi:hypothetical protein